ncbi:bifunctional DNA-formamidopyrimidine glycosylase/DNA-(apurinic or apyrimidinic site) lyase [Acidocella sp. KAb 2-4]|uniref:bifunctional DNA-formamidopyrimidine glycosylase/DNA-(apurinic or apyrimidinic site) lyase n=1 Tax=Acidocella sp. KAb 2-4 TaxID=2885158 RepID=UPI001D0850F5|nr:bifunctional DNA-formamidopyrimidine glycosylase/DNA-(apurinic or apyrimidinic site) lyase [Acidocella sp. KAb 2-4]MCB5943316.1 bifunctional DNA-formamidopyrimidine glycosylase/DNA-(apurinic or apyrimidinic site) lyase [Acidocella sp. KAb 2-4]
MPELPEVETVMRGLDARLTGRRIKRATLHRADIRWPVPPELPRVLTGARVLGFRRRGKFMLMRLDNGQSVLIHLGMSGRMLLDAPPAAHEHLTIETEEGGRVGFVDPRRFGVLDLVPTAEEDSHKLLAGMGPEPLGNEFSAPVLAAALKGRTSAIKAALLDQRIVAGIGNIYASEALFRAGIDPRRAAGKISRPRIEALVQAIRDTLREAIAAGGSSLRDYVQPNGELGYFQHAWKVYGRAGEACERCPGPPACHGIKCITQSGRSTYYCPKTQK